MKRFGRKKEFTTTRIIAVGFFVAIVIGTFLLMLPLSSKTGKVTGIVDALFTSTTSAVRRLEQIGESLCEGDKRKYTSLHSQRIALTMLLAFLFIMATACF